MTPTDILFAALLVIGFGVIRFGIPLLVTMLLKAGCCRLFHLEPK